MKRNIFQTKNANGTENDPNNAGTQVLQHAEFMGLLEDARNVGSFRKALNNYALEHGVTDIDLLFPDAQLVSKDQPVMYGRDMTWVRRVLNGTNHSPFSRVRTMYANISADAARAKGYVTEALKTDQIIALLRRETTPWTVYAKQSLNHEDVRDITDINVVVWLRRIMRVLLDEELARACLIGDGREADDPDKINEERIRPIWTDDNMYAHHVELASDATVEETIDAFITSMEFYRGSGMPTLFTSQAIYNSMKLLRTEDGLRVYKTKEELADDLGVSDIVIVPQFADLVRENDDEEEVQLIGIVVNLADYTFGADHGGEVESFEDFDIDYNLQKYLMEARASGALTIPKAAIVIEKSTEVVVEP